MMKDFFIDVEQLHIDIYLNKYLNNHLDFVYIN